MVVFNDGKLVNGEKFVVFGGFPVNQPELFAFGFAVFGIFNGDAFGEVAVAGFVIVDQVGTGDVL